MVRLEETRRRILEAAKRVFAEKSFFDATLEDIARSSGVKKSTIYYYFESKLDLLMEIVREVLEELAATLESSFAKGSAREVLSRFVEAYCTFFSQKRELFAVFQRAAFDLLSHEEAHRYLEGVAENLRKLRERLAERIGEITTRAGRKVSGDVLLRVVASSIGGYCMEAIREGKTVTEEDKEFLKEVFTAFLP